MKDTMAKALESKSKEQERVYVGDVRIICTVCIAGIKDLAAAEGTVLKWGGCNHQPRIILSTTFRIEDCTVVWEKVPA